MVISTLFNSCEFIFLFLPIVFFIYFLLGRIVPAERAFRFSCLWLVAASLIFYAWWDARYVVLLLSFVGINYFAGIRIAAADGGKRRLWLLLAVAADIIVLGYFKYAAFFLETAAAISGIDFIIPRIVLPLGISFYTFQGISYVIDVYQGKSEAQRNIVRFSLFIAFFPQLIAGPIVSPREMLPQFLNPELRPNYENIARGMAMFAFGLFKKVVTADTLAPWVNSLFARAGELTLIEGWLAAAGYTLQLYFDFSGYSEMAIGLGLLFNFKLPINFNSPYQAGSIIDFWRRWHMTLGRWVREYMYIPLGGNRVSFSRQIANLLGSMLLIGLWHGAGWTFVAWGGLHGIFLAINHSWHRFGRFALPKIPARLLTLLCVSAAWVLFRADNIGAAASVFASMMDFGNIALPQGGLFERHLGFLAASGIKFVEWKYNNLGMIIVVESLLFALVVLAPAPVTFIRNLRPNIRWLLAVALALFMSIWSIMMSGPGAFLYFQF